MNLIVRGSQRRYTAPATVLSIAFHTAIGAAVLYLAGISGSVSLPRTRESVTFLVFNRPPAAPPPTPIEPLRIDRVVAISRIPVVETPKEAAREPMKAPALPDNKPAEHKPAESVRAELPRPRPLPAPAPAGFESAKAASIKPVAPAVAVGAFPGTPLTARAEEAVRSVHTTGFETPAASAPSVKIAGPATGTFDQATQNAVVRPGTDRPATSVAAAGFGGPLAASSQPSKSPTAMVAEVGFGADKSDGRGARSASGRGTQVQKTDFDAAPAAPAAPVPVARPTVIDKSVEILFKPTPTYTEEARALKLEGDVVLDVEFGASGGINVLHVVQSLGHGLDEAAMQAAGHIRFKPAQSGGRSVSFRTTVHIVFRLA